MNNELVTRIKVNQNKLRSNITQLTSKRLAVRGVGNGAIDYNVGQIITLAQQTEKLIDELLTDANAKAARRDGVFCEYETRVREG